jgi:hypothetical protein
MKQPELGEVSSPGVTKQLDYTPRSELVIKIVMKKVFIQPPSFADIEESIGSKATLQHWGDIFKNISQEEFPEYIPHNDPDVRLLDNEVFPNI